MATINPSSVVRRARGRLRLSQEGLARLLNATKGAVQHWERGRNNPDLARLLALHRLCPPGLERRELEALIRRMQAPFVALSAGERHAETTSAHPTPDGHVKTGAELALLRRENVRLQRQMTKLEATLQRRVEQVRLLQDLAADLQREMTVLRAKFPKSSSLDGRGDDADGS